MAPVAPDFRTRWKSKFDEQARLFAAGRREHRHWEGDDAYRELQRKDALWLVLPEDELDGWPFTSLMARLEAEISTYERFEKVSQNNDCFRDALDALSGAERRLTRTILPESQAKGGVQAVLTKAISFLASRRVAMEQRRDSYWEETLLAGPQERKRWSVYMDKEKHVHSIPPQELSDWEKIFNDFSYPRKMVRQIDLDSRFQVRIAVILRFYLHQEDGVSLKTIARLTVLTYLCAGLAEDRNGHLTIRYTGKRLTVSAVDQKIRSAGLK